VNVVQEGTGKGVQISGLVIGGKTGTAQNPGGEDHAWFVAYAGREHEEPRLALAVLVSHGGHGGVTAAPVAKELIRAEFGL
jgi:penicillin-binding protein A